MEFLRNLKKQASHLGRGCKPVGKKLTIDVTMIVNGSQGTIVGTDNVEYSSWKKLTIDDTMIVNGSQGTIVGTDNVEYSSWYAAYCEWNF
ncbi:hypothetical protein TNCV_2855241 [Trichonephila clavipes]|nr:hypothetical protein TNCV_2855241 [Trichonephila clavipes]